MKKLFSHLLICVFAYSLIALALPPRPAYAEGENWVDNDYAKGLEAAFTGGINSPAYASHMNTNYMNDITRKILGPVRGVTVTYDAPERNPEYVLKMAQGSAVATINSYVVAMYANPAASTSIAIRDFGESLGFIPNQTYAQGIGFTGLQNLLPLWRLFRNIAYLILAVVMLVIGFMVMLRKKIDPKTVVTVQNALPKIIITLLLITFSYAIVGFMIDLMYLAILLAVSLFKQSGLLPNPSGTLVWLDGLTTPEDLYTKGSLWPNITSLDFSPWKLFFGWNGDSTLYTSVAGILGILGAIAGFALAGGPIGAIPGAVVALGMPLVSLLISLAALFLIIRLFVFFLGAYIKIIVALIFGPVQILFEAIPGTNAFTSWFRNLLANILVFPIGAIMFMLSAIFVKFSNEGGQIWHPPYVGFVSNVTSISSWVAIGIMFAIPTVVNSIQDLLKAKPIISAGPEGIAGAVSHPTLLAWQVAQFFIQHGQMKAISDKIGAQQKQAP